VADRRIRIGFVGAGGICRQRHLPALADMADVSVVAVANRSAESSRAVSREFAIPEWEPDWESLVRRHDIDAVFIGTWPYLHRDVAVAALQSGKHVFCQARMAMNLEEAKEMARVSRENPGLVAMVSPPPHRMPYEPYIVKTMASERVGEVLSVGLTAVGTAARQSDVLTWREDVRLSGRQALAVGILAEVLNAWLGPYEALSAFTAVPLPRKEDRRGREVRVRVPQVLVVAGRLASGALITEHHSGVAAGTEGPGTELTVWGANGTLRYDFERRELAYAPRGGGFSLPEVPESMRNPWRVEADFVEAVRSARRGEPFRVSPDFEEGLLYMRKVEAVYVSAETRRTVFPDRL
jgi:predicted dehydrogenase